MTAEAEHVFYSKKAQGGDPCKHRTPITRTTRALLSTSPTPVPHPPPRPSPARPACGSVPSSSSPS